MHDKAAGNSNKRTINLGSMQENAFIFFKQAG